MAAGPTIHIVDDDAAIRRSLEQLLHSAGFGSAVYETALGFLHPAGPLATMAPMVMATARVAWSAQLRNKAISAGVNRRSCSG